MIGELTQSEHYAAMGYATQEINRPMSRIIAEVSSETGFTIAELKGRIRDRPLVHARQYAIWRCFTETEFSKSHIGKFFGGRDHTTIIHALRRVEARIANEGK